MRTTFEQKNSEFSDTAHMAAQTQIYPYIFNPQCRLSFESTTLNLGTQQSILDGQMATDRIVSVSVESLKAPVRFYVQERFRRIQYARYQDITITEWNNASNQPSELYKLPGAGLFVYGYFDEQKQLFLDWIVVNTALLMRSIITEQLRCEFRQNNKRQDFINISFKSLRDSGSVIVEKRSAPFIETVSHFELAG